MNKRKNVFGGGSCDSGLSRGLNYVLDMGLYDGGLGREGNIAKYKLYNYYYNPLNCNKIELRDNHIYFNSLIHKDAIDNLINFAMLIIDNYKIFNFDGDLKIYIHINSKGGYLAELLNFINFKKTCEFKFELVSIIEKECYDSGFILAGLCDYRIVNKRAKIYMSKYAVNDAVNDANSFCNYWNYFKQCEVGESSAFQILLYDMLCNNICSKITREKLAKILQSNSCWDAKRYKKYGFADEIV
jgi:hypothetical protein